VVIGSDADGGCLGSIANVSTEDGVRCADPLGPASWLCSRADFPVCSRTKLNVAVSPSAISRTNDLTGLSSVTAYLKRQESVHRSVVVDLSGEINGLPQVDNEQGFRCAYPLSSKTRSPGMMIPPRSASEPGIIIDTRLSVVSDIPKPAAPFCNWTEKKMGPLLAVLSQDARGPSPSRDNCPLGSPLVAAPDTAIPVVVGRGSVPGSSIGPGIGVGDFEPAGAPGGGRGTPMVEEMCTGELSVLGMKSTL